MLVAHGARRFGESRLDPSCFVDSEALTHPKAFENWTRWKDILTSASTELTYDKMQDTVGAISFRAETNEIAAGVSRRVHKSYVSVLTLMTNSVVVYY